MIDFPITLVGFLHSAYDLDAPTFSFISKEVIDLFDGSVIREHFVSVVCGIENQVLAHDSQADEAEICTVDGAFRVAGTSTGERNAFVSKVADVGQRGEDGEPHGQIMKLHLGGAKNLQTGEIGHRMT